jgi:dTMP kinase
MNASRAQLVREVIRPALAACEIVVCDRFLDSTTAYQGHGRELDPVFVEAVIEFAVGETRPDLTLLLEIPLDLSESRRESRLDASRDPQSANPRRRDRMEEADRTFFLRVQEGFQRIAATEPDRVRVIDATQTVAEVSEAIWKEVARRLP